MSDPSTAPTAPQPKTRPTGLKSRRSLLARVVVPALAAALLAAHTASLAQAAATQPTAHRHDIALQATPTVTVTSVSRTTATLTITDYTGDWSVSRRVPSATPIPCTNSDVGDDDPSEPINLLDLRPGHVYRFAAHGGLDCTGDNLGAVWFITSGMQTTPTMMATSVLSDAATLKITDYFGDWSVSRRIPSATPMPCTNSDVGANDPSEPINLRNLMQGQVYAFWVHGGLDCAGSRIGEIWFITPGLVLPSPALIVPENGTADSSIRLRTAPDANVIVSVNPSGDGNITVLQRNLTFTTANWSTPQTITVTASEDSDFTNGSNIIHLRTTSTDNRYNSLTSTITASEGDNDRCAGTAAVGGATVTSGGLVDDCNTLLAALGTLAGDSASNDDPPNWSTATAMSSWDGVTAATEGVTDISLPSGGDATVKGRIPNTFGNLASLEELDLSGQDLTGGIPRELGNLTNLDSLFLHNNELTGQIPAELGERLGLDALTVFGNNLSGCIPPGLLKFKNRSGVVSGSYSTVSGVNHQLDAEGNSVNLFGCLGIGIYKSRVSVSEGSTATYTVRLGVQPYDTVQVVLTRTGDNDITSDTNTISSGWQHSIDFTTDNWNFPKTVTLTAAEDDDSLSGVTTIIHTARSPDFRYDNLTATVIATESDNDTESTLNRIAVDGAAQLAFTPAPAAGPATAAGTAPAATTTDYFTDDDGSAFEGSINLLAAEGIAQGCNATGTLFCPNRDITRAEMAVFLQRALDLPIPADTHQFEDTEGAAQGAIAAVAAAGITVGCNDAGTLFCPNRSVTRAEMAVFLQRGFDLPIPADTYRFQDTEGFAQDAIAAIAEAGITVGCNDAGTLFCPDQPVSRGQMAAFLSRALDL